MQRAVGASLRHGHVMDTHMLVAYSWCLGWVMPDSVPGANGELKTKC